MADAGRDQHGVAGADMERLAALAAEADLRRTLGDAQHLVRGRMVVVEREDAVPPAAAPAVAVEQRLEGDGRIAGRRVDGAGIDDQAVAVVGNIAVVGENVAADLHGLGIPADTVRV